MKILFFGTPGLAVPSLDAVAQLGDVALVVCQPDRRSGRGMKLRPPPVKVRALELGIDVIQPKKVRTAAFAESLARAKADVAVVIAYGRILPKAVLESTLCGFVNVHASLLPRWRGAGPIQWSIVHGDAESGVCLMKMDEGMDTGPVFARACTPIEPNETAEELGARLSEMGAAMLTEHLAAFVAGGRELVPQPDVDVTHAPLIKKEDGRIDWILDARAVHDRVRGLHPWPGAFTSMADRTVKIHRTEVRGEGSHDVAPGTIVSADPHGIEVACGIGQVAILELQLRGKKRLGAADFLAGHRWSSGDRLGDHPDLKRR